jgi:hypothetical protein
MAIKPVIRVGITGHRKGFDSEKVQEAISRILREIRPEPKEQMLIMISPLAEGADRLAATATLQVELSQKERNAFEARKNDRAIKIATVKTTACAKELAEQLAKEEAKELPLSVNSYLQVVLPMPKDEYCKDFKTNESLDEFNTLLEEAVCVSELDLLSPRNKSYEAVGKHIVNNCDVMIAVWNGEKARGPGGTAEIVDYAKKQGRPLYWIDSNSLTEKKMPANSEMIEGTWVVSDTDRERLQDSGGWGEKLIKTIQRQSCKEHDQDVINELVSRLVQVVSYLTKTDEPSKPIKKTAQYYQDKYRNSSKIIYTLAVLAVVIVSVQSIFHLNHWIILGEVFAISYILYVFWRSRKERWHSNWIESRLETEWLRISVSAAFLRGITKNQFINHWAIHWVKDEECVIKVQEMRNELGKHLVYLPEKYPSPPSSQNEKRLLILLKDYMRHSWLIHQKKYHANKAKEQEFPERVVFLATQTMFWVTFLVALLHLIPHSAFHLWHISQEPIVRVLTLLAIALPTAGAALTGLESHFEYSKIARRSTYMVSHLVDLENKLDGVKSIKELAKLVDETENLMLQENSDWFFMIGIHSIKAS